MESVCSNKDPAQQKNNKFKNYYLVIIFTKNLLLKYFLPKSIFLCVYVCLCVHSVAQSSLTLGDSMVACQASLSVDFPRREYCSGLPFPSPGDLPHPGIEPMSFFFWTRVFCVSCIGRPGKPRYLLTWPLGKYFIPFSFLSCIHSTYFGPEDLSYFLGNSIYMYWIKSGRNIKDILPSPNSGAVMWTQAGSSTWIWLVNSDRD